MEEKTKEEKKNTGTRIMEGSKKAFNLLVDEGYQSDEIEYIADIIRLIANAFTNVHYD